MTDLERAARAEAEQWANRTPVGPESAPIQAFEAGWNALAEYLLSDEAVKRAAEAMWFEDCGVSARGDDAEPFREYARAALTAVLGSDPS